MLLETGVLGPVFQPGSSNRFTRIEFFCPYLLACSIQLGARGLVQGSNPQSYETLGLFKSFSPSRSCQVLFPNQNQITLISSTRLRGTGPFPFRLVAIETSTYPTPPASPTSTAQRQLECPTTPILFDCAQLIASHRPSRAVDKMDPLSITVSCLTLIGVASKTSLAVTTFIRGCRDARSDLTSVSGELTQLQLVLELLKDDPDVTDDRIIPESLQAQILSIIANCSDVVGKINKVLNKHAGRAGPAKWTAFGKTEVDGLRMSLEAHRGSLSLVLELVSVSLSKAIKEDTAATRTDVRDIRQDTSHIPHIMAELAELRAIVAAGGQSYVLEQYLDSLTSYAETVCQDVVWDSDGSMHLPSAKVSPMPSPKPTPKPSPGNLDQPQETRELELEELRLDPTQGDAETPPNQSSAPSANMETSRGEIEVRVSEPRHGPTEADHPPSRGHSGTPSNAGSTAVAYPTRTLAGTHPNPSHPQSPGNLPLRRLSVRKKVVVIGDGVGKTSFIVCVCPFPVPCSPPTSTNGLHCRTVPMPTVAFQT
jgi:hypothetical protein